MNFPEHDGGVNGEHDNGGARRSIAHLAARCGTHLRKPLWRRALLLAGLCSVSAMAAEVLPSMKDPADTPETERGIPVTDATTLEKCGTCHTRDDKGDLSRISWIRATPEGWAQAIDRMVKLNGAQVTPDEARHIVRYLSTSHGLAPDEDKKVFYMAERRTVDETIIPNDTIRETCAACHAFGRPMSSRRSRREWALLENMHKALYEQAQTHLDPPVQGENGAPPPKGPDGKPMSRGAFALNYLSKAAPLHTAEWAAWQPRIHAPQLSGKWAVSASLPGHGKYIGEMTISPGASPEEFKTVTTLRSLDTGATMTRTGSGIVYGGYSWRGRSDAGAGKTAQPDDPRQTTREAMMFSPGENMATGRWYWGQYHEFGFDVTLTRATDGSAISGVAPYALKAGSTGATLHIYGQGLPTTLTPADINLGAGVTVQKIVSASPTETVVTVDVAANAAPGQHDAWVKGAGLPKALPIYDKLDYIKVTPDTAIAHLGGIHFAKGYEQFGALGYSNGPDGKRGTDDDFSIGPVKVDWSMQEFSTVPFDDDTHYVGTLSSTGLFTPNVEGPDPKRKFGRNNYGDVWVVATDKSALDKGGKPLTGRSYLVVSVPMYKQWDQPEIDQ